MPNTESDSQASDSTIPSTGDLLERITNLNRQALADTEHAINERKQLTERFLHEIELELQSALRMLDNLGPPWHHGDRTDYELMRISLDKAITARKKERREQLLKSWKDLRELRESKRTVLRDLVALE